ncbi:hypothetical protein [Winogradskyella sp. PE311]|uniref:hypothetical protein n=1 Tax=Winogradskyella sp. PE311 TaxID=3366943 RepID=UPI00397F77CD
MICNFIQIQKDSISKPLIEKMTNVSTNTDSALSYWFWIGLLELVIITVLIYKVYHKNKKLDFADLTDDKFKAAKSSKIDMNSLMQSINESKDIYKELSKLCHPDRFINSDKHDNALAIFQEISNNKRNYKELANLKERAIIELEIKIK